jgi:glycosyltransferase involved in cell wall biosynthesis
MQLYALLESIEKNINGLADIFIITRSSSLEYEQAYSIVKERFPAIYFFQQCSPYDDLKDLTLHCFEKNKSKYILFAVDDIIIKDIINLEECIEALEKFNAHGFYFRLGKNLDHCFAMAAAQPLPPLKNINSTMNSWQFSQGIYDWNYPNNIDFTLYRKTDLKDALYHDSYKTPNSLESALMMHANANKTGLCFETSKIVNFPLNIVQKEHPNPSINSYSTGQLLKLFNDGLKINIKVIEKINNKSAHAADSTPIKFIARQEKLIVIVTPSYNNSQWWEWNLTSLINQNYHNYYILITDDCSTDGTGTLIEDYIEKHQLHHKVKLIKNKERRGALHNLYTMIHQCPNEAICVTVDGDDALSDPNVLSHLNEIYSKQEVWLTYGQFIEHPSGTQGWCMPMPEFIVNNNAFREHPHLPSHLRTFYAWLFKRIKLEDLLDQKGDFYSMTWDCAIMLPMIEMAAERHLCIQNQIMYIYNNANTISDHRVSRQLQQHFSQLIRSKSRYMRLPAPTEDFAENLENEKVDFIIFAEQANPDALEQCVLSIQKNCIGYGEIYILYQPNKKTAEKYDVLKDEYPSIFFLEIDEYKGNFKAILSGIYQYFLKNKYVIFTDEKNQIIAEINLSSCIKALEETQAYAFHLTLSKENSEIPIPSRLSVHDIMPDICAWNYALGNNNWASANNLEMTLYRRNMQLIIGILCDSTRWLWSSIDLLGWWSQEGNLDKIGLCFKYPKTRRLNS